MTQDFPLGRKPTTPHPLIDPARLASLAKLRSEFIDLGRRAIKDWAASHPGDEIYALALAYWYDDTISLSLPGLHLAES